MNSILKLFLFVLIVTVTGTPALAGDVPPRLWEVTGKNEHGVSGKFYILPVTHNGLAAEHDDYFYKTVVPIAMSADEFLSETSHMFPEHAPACTTPLSSTKENQEILEKARVAVERAQFDLIPPAYDMPGLTARESLEISEALHLTASSLTKNLSEYGLLLAMQSFLTSTQLYYPGRLPRADADYMSRPDIGDFLRYKRGKLGKDTGSIDDSHDLWASYCNIGESRIDYLKRRIVKLDPKQFVYPSKDEIAQMNMGFREAVREGRMNSLFVDSMEPYLDYFVCDRNDKWLTKMTEGLANGIKFYSLGYAHVLQPGPDNPNRCDGLLTRLRHAGYKVTLLE